LKKRYIVLLVVLSGGVLYLFYWSQDFDISVLRRLPPHIWLLGCSLSFVSLFVYLLAINILLRGMSFRTPLRLLFLILSAAGTTTTMSPVKVGIPVRIYLLKRRLSIPISTGVGAIAIETSFLLFWMMGIFLLPIPRLDGFGNIRIVLIVLVALFGVLYLLLLLRPRDLSRLFSRFAFKGKGKRLIDFAVSFQEGLKQASKKALIVVFGLFLLRFIIDAFFLYFVLLGFGHRVNPLYLLYSKNVAYVVGTLSMIPTGLGSSDLTFMFFLSKLGIPKQVMLSCVLVDRLLYTLLPFLIGLVSANILGVQFLRRKKGEVLNRFEVNHQQARAKQN